MDEKKEQKCLWCSEPLKEGQILCTGGGPTIGISATGEGNARVTKSYCLNSLLQSMKINTEYTEEEKTFLLYEEQIRAWYKALPLLPDKSVVREQK